MKEQIRNRCVCVNLAIMTALVAGPSARAEVPPGYEIIQITDDGLLDFVPSINSCGVVAWMRQLDARRESAEIFTYDDATGLITQITDDNIRDSSPDISDDGTIVWVRQIGPNDTFEIAMWRDGEMTLLTDNSFNDTSPSINNLGHVVWDGEAGAGCSDDEVFFFDGDRIERITRNNGFSDQGPRINDHDQIAWTRFDFCQNPWTGTIMLYSQGETRALNGGEDQEQGGDINNNTQVTWDTALAEIIIWENDGTRELTDNGIIANLNDNGDVTFIRWDDERATWDQWLFLNGVFYELTREPQWDRNGRINNTGEVTWNSGPFPRTEIMLLRRKRGDADGDGDTDHDDYSILMECLGGPGNGYENCECRFMDFDRDKDVDVADFARFQTEFRRSP